MGTHVTLRFFFWLDMHPNSYIFSWNLASYWVGYWKSVSWSIIDQAWKKNNWLVIIWSIDDEIQLIVRRWIYNWVDHENIIESNTTTVYWFELFNWILTENSYDPSKFNNSKQFSVIDRSVDMLCPEKYIIGCKLYMFFPNNSIYSEHENITFRPIIKWNLNMVHIFL